MQAIPEWRQHSHAFRSTAVCEDSCPHMLGLFLKKATHHVVHCMQECREVMQQGARELYEGYRAYALNTSQPWMQAIDAAAVRQVGPLFLW